MDSFILFKPRIYQYSFCILIGVIGLTFYHRAAHFDDAWFAEQSYWLVKNGQVRSEFFRGYNNWEEQIYIFHKLFVYAGALFMGITNFSLPFSKLITPLFGCLTGWLIWYHTSKQPTEERWIAILIYFGCGTIIRYFFVNRPEIMCMSLGFASYVCLERSANVRSKLILAAILAGLSALTHLNGVIYLIAGFLWTFIRINWRSAIWFSIAGALTFSLYGLDALVNDNVNLMAMQFLNDPATQSGLKLTDKLLVMLNYHQLFFHSNGEVPLTILTLLCLLAFRRYLQLTQSTPLYLLLLISTFWLLSKSNFDFYYILFVPWLSLFIAHCLINYLLSTFSTYKLVAKYSLIVYFIISLFSVFKVLQENYTQLYIPRYNAELAQHMPHQHTKIIAPISFFWGQHGNYQIHGLTYYHLLERRNGSIPLSTFFNMAAQEGIEYIVTDALKNASYEIPLTAPAHIGSFNRIFQDQYTSIYERQ